MTEPPPRSRLLFCSRFLPAGSARLEEMAWIGLEALLVASPIRLMARCRLLAAFGAKLGRGVVIKPGVRVKFPRKLAIGDHSWIGERVWIDNLAPVEIGANCCISQGAYLCAGSHD